MAVFSVVLSVVVVCAFSFPDVISFAEVFLTLSRVVVVVKYDAPSPPSSFISSNPPPSPWEYFSSVMTERELFPNS